MSQIAISRRMQLNALYAVKEDTKEARHLIIYTIIIPSLFFIDIYE